ncbi:MAG: hypothetical protein BJ554DRAFT_1327 [Olpidium bornovanus]|uniref:Uncharacterized protein n=1 Tax=Olpidium bornovanus TaxID=278681 RepID=A0A8H7ZSH7_9FUNG|nr:MAG: hypothetical protein BJ554DRAFT_1327 [Olpidium bornovanus]
MRNNEKDPVEVQLKADVRRDKGDGVFALNANAAEIDAVADVPLGSIPPGGVLDRTVYMRCGDVLGERILTLLIRYELKSASPPGGQSHTFEKKRVLHIPVVQAFEPTFEVNPLCSGDLITGVDPGDGPIVALPDGAGLVEHVLLVCGLKSTAPWELEVAEIRLHLANFGVEKAAGETTAITELTSTEAGEMKGDYSRLRFGQCVFHVGSSRTALTVACGRESLVSR